MPIWNNQDGLLIKTGRDEAVSGTSGQYGETFSGNHVIEANVTLANYAAGQVVILEDNIRFPRGFRIERVESYVETAAAGGTSIDFGLIASDRVTAIDPAGFIAASPTANLTPAGKRTNYDQGGTNSGALVGTLTTPAQTGAYLTFRANGTFTAGVIKLRIIFHKP